MHAIRKSSSHHACTPNVLPCRIQHSGPVDASRRFWDPAPGERETKTAYFRGRKLYGREAKVPTGYRGVVLVGSEKVLERKKESVDDGYSNLEGEESMPLDEEEEEEEVKVMEEVGIFNGVWVWGHEMVMDSEDPYVRSLEEWVGVAESINSFAEDTNGIKELVEEKK